MSAFEPSWTAEQAAADWMRRHGFPDATVMNAGVDTGVHVIASRAAAQVRTSFAPVGPEDLSRLVRDSRAMPGCRRIFFSLSGYSDRAMGFAEEHGIALLIVGRDGSVVPANAWGENLSGSRFGGGPLAMRPQAPAALAAPMAPARGSGWKHPVTWYAIGGFSLAVAVAGVSNISKGEDVAATIGVMLLFVILAWASFRYARRLERRRQ